MLGIPFLDDAVNKLFKPQSFDDPIDRLNYFMTSTLLTFFALMVSAKQYVGAPIQCWMPMEFKGGWEQYAEDYCFIQNTYYVEPENEIPTKIEERDEKQFGYYQWVPVVLAIQAFMFFLPNWIWKTMHQQSGIDLGTAVSDAQKLRSMPAQDRRDEIEKLSNYVSECLEINQTRPTPRRILMLQFGRSLGSYVSCLYIFIKLLYVLNIFGQFYLLNSFIGRDYHLWGWTALTSLWTGNEWADSPVFPRVSLCDFRIRRLANFHRYTVQCVLMINMFNEKIYLFIWFWFLFVGISTVINFFYVLATLLPEGRRRGTLYQLLKTEEMRHLLDDEETRACLDRFVRTGLRPGAIVARDLSTKLFKDYLENLPNFSKQIYSQSTKSTSPGIDDHYTREPLTSHQFNEKLEDVDSGFGKPKYV
ncbi:Innexin [Aphelenchoides besseyi]|nr:Innexin [Aphelenchoides besseyi]